MRDLALSFPIARVDSLRQGLELHKSCGFTLTRNLVSDARRKSVIELAAESAVSKTADLGSKALELYNILIDAVRIAHDKLLELHFCISRRIMGTEV